MPAPWTTEGPVRADMVWEQGQGQKQNKHEGMKESAAVKSSMAGTWSRKPGRKQQIPGQRWYGAPATLGPAQPGVWSCPIATTLCPRARDLHPPSPRAAHQSWEGRAVTVHGRRARGHHAGRSGVSSSPHLNGRKSLFQQGLLTGEHQLPKGQAA